MPGSGQGALNPIPATMPPGVSRDDALHYGTTVARLKSDLTAVGGRALGSAQAIEYPAVSVLHYLGAGGLTGGLDASELVGVKVLLAAIGRARTGACAQRPLLLAGYSQGAEVVMRAVDQLPVDQQRHIAIALFGNPSYQPRLVGDVPGTSEASGIRPTFRHMAITLPASVRASTIDICAPGDPVCGVDPTRTSTAGRVAYVIAHVKIHENAYAYGTDGYTTKAAQFLVEHAD